ncbi:MAG: hypothetical protein JNM36_03065 [Chitinophagales bacterium]|jgi:hypothetical protein|nr:hypothetical protein [Chitinophagales bacterium]
MIKKLFFLLFQAISIVALAQNDTYIWQVPVFQGQIGKCYAIAIIDSVDTNNVLTKAEQQLLTEVINQIEPESISHLEAHKTFLLQRRQGVKKPIDLKISQKALNKIKLTAQTENLLVRPKRLLFTLPAALKECMQQPIQTYKIWCLKELPAEYRIMKRIMVDSLSLPKGLSISEQLLPDEEWVITPLYEEVESVDTNCWVDTLRANSCANAIYAFKPIVIKTNVIAKERVAYLLDKYLSRWVETPCKYPSIFKISAIKTVLKEQGYYRGYIDEQADHSFTKALYRFKLDKGLPIEVGGDERATMKALGLLNETE